MSALSDYAENKVLDAIGANATFTTPSAVYLGLSCGGVVWQRCKRHDV